MTSEATSNLRKCWAERYASVPLHGRGRGLESSSAHHRNPQAAASPVARAKRLGPQARTPEHRGTEQARPESGATSQRARTSGPGDHRPSKDLVRTPPWKRGYLAAHCPCIVDAGGSRGAANGVWSTRGDTGLRADREESPEGG